MTTVNLPKEACIEIEKVTQDLNLYNDLYLASLRDKDIAEYTDIIIMDRLANIKIQRESCVSKYINKYLPTLDSKWTLDFNSGELKIND